MKNIIRKVLSVGLAAALLAQSAAFASEALGHDLAATEALLSEGTELASGTFWSDSHTDLRRENYVAYTPGERVTPVVFYGDSSRALTTVPAAAKALEEGGKRVVAGINGDYYDTANGLPIGSTMVNGELRNISGDPYYAVGFHADGTAVIGDPKLSVTATVNGGSGFPVFAFNYIRHSDFGIFLYDHRFNAQGTAGLTEPGVDVLCSVESGALTIGGQLALRVDEVLPEASGTAIPAGKFLLTANLGAGEGYTAPLLALQSGDSVVLSVSSGTGDPAWNSVVNLLGAPELLVSGGAVAGGLPAGSAPRTAIGQRPDGTLLLYTIDGRRAGYSIGATLTAVAMRLVELGCVTAVALDGGGSTALAATLPDETAARLINTPSENSPRAVSNHLFLVADNTPSGSADHVYLSAAADKALPGAKVALSSALIDTNYIPMDTPVSLRTDRGSVADGVLTVPDSAGTVTVTAEAEGLSAETTVEAALPERISVQRGGTEISSVTIAPGKSVSLTAQGITNHLPLAGGNDCFRWEYEGTGVTLSDGGSTLTAGKDAAAGTLTVSLGEEMSVSLPVTVAVVPLRTLNDFEGPFDDYTTDPEEEAAQLTLSRVTGSANVRFGKAAAKLDYRIEEGASAAIPVDWAVPAEYNCVELWACGDGGHSLLSLETDAGESVAAGLSHTGWGALALKLPDGARRITGLRLAAQEACEGTVLLDQLVLAYDYIVDTAAPEVSLTFDPETGVLSGRAFDAVDGATIPAPALRYDGAALDFSFDSRTGALSAALPEADGFAHRVTLTAADAAGNLARTSVSIDAEEDAEPAFPDTEGHWADSYVSYLKRSGVSNGDGGNYRPDAPLTRQEFAVMLCRALSPEEDYSATELPFADAEDIGGWAAESVRAMYALGVTGGANNDKGELCFFPRSPITRQEAMTMVGRLLDKGYAAPQMGFADAEEIPAWAAEHVRVLSYLGVLGGFEDNTFRGRDSLTRAQIAAVLYRLN